MNDNNEIIIAEINLDTPHDIFLKESTNQVNLGGKGKDKAGVCYIKVKGNEGTIPHFHIESRSNPKFFCCVCIYVAEYFHHLNNEVDLSRDQTYVLDNELSKIWNDIHTSWQQLNIRTDKDAAIFNNYCKQNNLDPDYLRKPDYTTLPTS